MDYAFGGCVAPDAESFLAVAGYCSTLCVSFRCLVAMAVLILSLCITDWSAAQTRGVPSQTASTSDSTTTVKRASKSPSTAVRRSLIPGGGQFYNGQIIKGLIVIAGQVTLIGLAIHYDQKSKDFLSGSAEKERFVDDRNLTFWLMGGLTLLSMVDAYIDAQLYDFDTGPDLALRLGTIHNPTLASAPVSLGMSLRATF